MTKVKVNKVTIRLARGEPYSIPVDGVVTGTDTNLNLDPQLLRAAGVEIQRELADIGWCDVGSAVITDAGALNAKKLIHVVGPRWGEGSERGKLMNATLECLLLAEQNGLRSLALPALSTGAAGYPVENCARTMLTQIIDYTFEELRTLRTVVLCLSDDWAYEVFKAELVRQVDELRESNEGKVQV